MIIWLFITFFAMALVFIFYGANNNDAMSMTIGFALMIFPSFALSGIDAPLLEDTPGIQYPVGQNTTIYFNESYKYGNNFTGYHWDYIGNNPTKCADAPNPTSDCTWLFHRYRDETQTEETLYESYTNWALGALLLLVASFGMWFSISSSKGDIRGVIPRINWRFYR